MKKSTLAIIIVVVLALGVGGFFIFADDPDNESNTSESTSETQQIPDTSTDNQNTQAETDQVSIENFAFSPTSVTVKKGTTVTWTNRDSTQHSVIPDETSDAFEGSELLAKDASYSFTFDTAGTYTYHCGPHPEMLGTVVVTE